MRVIKRFGAQLRALRLQRNLTIKELADRTGLTSSLISQVERDVANASLASLFKIAAALEVNVSELFTDGEFRIIRRQERQVVLIPGSEVQFELVSPERFLNRVVYVRLEPGQATHPVPHSHEGSECTVVISGQVQAEVAGQRFTLGTGDSLFIDSRSAHRYVHAGDGAAELMMFLGYINPTR